MISFKKEKKNSEERIEDAYDDSSSRMSDEEAHRNAKYEVPSKAAHIKQCYMLQMKRYAKDKIVWVFLIFLIAIPVAYFILKLMDKLVYLGLDNAFSVNEFMATLLILTPVMTILISGIACGSMLPQEFNERTAYLSLPLPMNRSSFYFGKYLAGLSLTLGVTIAAYGLAVLIALTNTSTSYTSPIFVSMIVAICGVFFYTSFAYMMSTFMKRGSSLLPIIILLVLLPGLCVGLAIAGVGGIIGYIPCFATDLAIINLGTTMYPIGSLHGLYTFFGNEPFIGTNIAVMCIVSIVLAIICLYAGYRVIKRRNL